MRLSELVSNISGTLFTQIAFILFLMATVTIVYIVFSRRNSELFERARSMPLDDAETVGAADDGAPRGVLS